MERAKKSGGNTSPAQGLDAERGVLPQARPGSILPGIESVAQRELRDAIDQGPRMSDQRSAIVGMDRSPRQLVEYRRLTDLYGGKTDRRKQELPEHTSRLDGSVGTASGTNSVLQGRFEFPEDGPMAAWIHKLRDIPSVAGMAEAEDFVVRFETEDAPDEKRDGYTYDEGDVLVIGVNTARVENEGHALHTLTHELVLHAEPAWADGSLESVLETDTIREQHEEIIEQQVDAPDDSRVDGSYRNAQRIVLATLVAANNYVSMKDFVIASMEEQLNVMLLTLNNFFNHKDSKAPASRQHGREFTAANLTKARNNVVLGWNEFLGLVRPKWQQHIMHRMLIDQVVAAVLARKNEIVAEIVDMRESARKQGL